MDIKVLLPSPTYNLLTETINQRLSIIAKYTKKTVYKAVIELKNEKLSKGDHENFMLKRRKIC